MKSIERRLEKLEKNPKINEPERDIWLAVVTGTIEGSAFMDTEAYQYAQAKYREESEAKIKAAIAEYRAAHPEDAKRKINIIGVVDEECKRLLERIRAGERTRG